MFIKTIPLIVKMADKPKYASIQDFYRAFDPDEYRTEGEALEHLRKQGYSTDMLKKRSVYLAQWELQEGWLEVQIRDHPTSPAREYRKTQRAPLELPTTSLPGFR